jgi:hypothetical protein
VYGNTINPNPPILITENQQLVTLNVPLFFGIGVAGTIGSQGDVGRTVFFVTGSCNQTHSDITVPHSDVAASHTDIAASHTDTTINSSHSDIISTTPASHSDITINASHSNISHSDITINAAHTDNTTSAHTDSYTSHGDISLLPVHGNSTDG